MTIKLVTETSSATILPQRGALVSSLFLASGDHDIFWLPQSFDPTASSWPGGGLPFLFPFAGRVWHQGEIYRYKVGSDVLNMPLHGFSWATKWLILEQSSDRVVLELHDDEISRTIFPFKFNALMTMTLRAEAFSINIHVTHVAPVSDAPKMPLAMGWHPYFRLSEGLDRLSVPAQIIYPVTSIGGAGKPLQASASLGPDPWPLPHQYLNSLILSELDRPEAKLFLSGSTPATSERTPLTIRLTFGPSDVMRHIVTWTNEPTKFQCVEPWMSLPDAVATPTGCRWLSQGESIEAFLKVSV
jgi:galactose mutarotase-like enzyme